VINSHLNYGEGERQSYNGFGEKQNLNFAFGLADFSGTEESADVYEDYGSIKMYYEYWNE
jgi:hypothetical protein